MSRIHCVQLKGDPYAALKDAKSRSEVIPSFLL